MPNNFLEHQVSPNKVLGQNFLISKSALNNIILSGELSLEDIVLEIGAGTGILTNELVKYVKKVIAVEKDNELVQILKEKFKNHKNIEIIEGDIRDLLKSHNSQKGYNGYKALRPLQLYGPYKIIANLPYYLSSFVIRQLLEIKNKPQMMVLTLQKELAERICAPLGKMSIISAMARFYGSPSLGKVIKKTAFWPVPKVDSRIIIIKDIRKSEDIDEKAFSRVVRIGFSSRRKMLLNNLHNGLKTSKDDLKKTFCDIGLNEMVRAQELSVEDWKKITNQLVKN